MCGWPLVTPGTAVSTLSLVALNLPPKGSCPGKLCAKQDVHDCPECIS